MKRFIITMSAVAVFLTIVFLSACKPSGPSGESYTAGKTYEPGPSSFVVYEDNSQALYLAGHRMWREAGGDTNYYAFRFWHEGDVEISIVRMFVDGENIALDDKHAVMSGTGYFDYIVSEDCLSADWMTGPRVVIKDKSEIVFTVETVPSGSVETMRRTVQVKANSDALVEQDGVPMLTMSEFYDISK